MRCGDYPGDRRRRSDLRTLIGESEDGIRLLQQRILDTGNPAGLRKLFKRLRTEKRKMQLRQLKLAELEKEVE